MSVADQPTKQNFQSVSWQRVLPLLTVFAAAFLLFGLLWPAMSPGVRASITVDFCLPQNVSELSDNELDLLKTAIANQVSNQLTGLEFDSLIQQTQQTGTVVSGVIEYFDREAIVKSINLGFAIDSGKGRLQVDYTCRGNTDQVRFLQLLGQRLAYSIENLTLNPERGTIVTNQLNFEKFDRAIWLANQVKSDFDQIRQKQMDASYGQVQNGRTSPYELASTSLNLNQRSPSEQPAMSNALNSIDVSSLPSLLTEIKAETATHGNNETLSVLEVAPVKVWAINATPDRWAMVGLFAMAGLVCGFFALYQFAPAKPATNAAALSQSLGIPVVAVLTSDQKSKAKFGSVEFLSSLANTLLMFSKIFLIAVAVVVVGFMLIDSSIRESFFQNPFDGVAKIFRVFFGYA